jgi:hypothetical protein
LAFNIDVSAGSRKKLALFLGNEKKSDWARPLKQPKWTGFSKDFASFALDVAHLEVLR